MKKFFVFCMCMLNFAQSATAREPRPALSKGMRAEAVATAWGEPQEKIEREIKREEVWRYPEGELVFHEGELNSFPGLSDGDAKSDMGAPSKYNETKARTPNKPSEKGKQVQLSDIFGEVKRGMGPDTDTQKNLKPGPGGPPAMNSFMGPMGRPGPVSRPGEVEADLD